MSLRELFTDEEIEIVLKALDAYQHTITGRMPRLAVDAQISVKSLTKLAEYRELSEKLDIIQSKISTEAT